LVKTDFATASLINNYQVKKKRDLFAYILKKEYLRVRFIILMA